jgi:antitoxin component of MazEF toxin-antitoxin module
MTQKLLKVGDSAAVTIPKKAMEELGLKIGDDINVKVDLKKRVVLVQPNKQLSKEDKKIAELTLNFINRYRKDLEHLAKN